MDNESERGGEVTQADREAAADLLDIEHGRETEWSRRVRDGRYDDAPHVRLFAHHRIASTNATTGWRSDADMVRERIVWIQQFCQKLRNGTDDWFDLVEVQMACSQALQHLPPPTIAGQSGEGA